MTYISLQMKKSMEKKIEELLKKHKKELEDAKEGYRQQLEEFRLGAANKLANREEALRIQMADLKKRLDAEKELEIQKYDKMLSSKDEYVW